jgi:hypothetical protein
MFLLILLLVEVRVHATQELVALETLLMAT